MRLSRSRYNATREAAWRAAFAGNDAAAFRQFRIAADLAASDALRLLALVDRASLIWEMDEPFTAADALDEAEELARSVDWSATSRRERFALLQLAILLARREPLRADAALRTYEAIAKHDSGCGDKRQRAAEAHAFGATAAACGHAAAAAPLFAEAFRLYRERRCAWRAALVALDLHELSGDDALLGFAQRRAKRMPHSWLARRVGKSSFLRSSDNHHQEKQSSLARWATPQT